jgi:aspartyl-tRNA synthetase
MNSWAQGEGQPGLGYIFWRGAEGTLDTSKDEERVLRDKVQKLLDEGHVIEAKKLLENSASGPVAKNLGVERTERLRAQLGLLPGDAVFFRRRRAARLLQIRRRGAHQGRRRPWP